MVALFDIAPVERSLAPLLAHVYPGIDLTPTSRTPNSAKRAARIQELSALIEDFNTTIDVVGRLEDSVAQLMRELRRRRAAAEMALAPVTGLPNEVLEEVFLIVAANDTTSMAHIPISHVSSRWRVVSIGLKQLWTTILHPGLLHEYAERSKDLRLHFTPLPKARWPSDLEIAPAEASRLSTLLFRHSIHLGDKALGAPPERFVSSLERVGSQLALDRVEIAGVEGAFEQPAIAEYLRLEPTERDFVESVCKTKSFSGLALSNMAVSECGSWLLNAPSISQIQLHTIFGDNVAEHLAMDAQVVDDATDITPPRSCRKLKSLTMTRCCEDVYLPVIHDWLMPSLESLTLNLHEPGEACWSHRHYATFSESLLELVCCNAQYNKTFALPEAIYSFLTRSGSRH